MMLRFVSHKSQHFRSIGYRHSMITAGGIDNLSRRQCRRFIQALPEISQRLRGNRQRFLRLRRAGLLLYVHSHANNSHKNSQTNGVSHNHRQCNVLYQCQCHVERPGRQQNNSHLQHFPDNAARQHHPPGQRRMGIPFAHHPGKQPFYQIGQGTGKSGKTAK